MRANEHRRDLQKRHRMTIVVMFLVVLFCILLAPTRRLSSWLNAQEGAGEVADGTNASDVNDTGSLAALDSGADGSQDSDGQGGANAISPFEGPSTGADRLFGLDDTSDADGGYPGVGGFLAGTPLVSGLSLGPTTPELDALNASAGFGGALSGGGVGSGAFGGSQAGGATLGGLAAGGWGSVGGGGGGGGGAASGGGGGAASSGSGGSASGGNGGTSDNSGNGSGHDGSGSGNQGGDAPGSGGNGSSGGGNDDSIVFAPDQGDHGPSDHPDGVNVSVYPSGPDGSTILSDPDDKPSGPGSSGGLVISAIDATTPVPEPATLLLLGSGLVGIGYRFKRRS